MQLDRSHAFTEHEWKLVRVVAEGLEWSYGWSEPAAQRLRFMLDFAYATGLRISELVGARLGAIDSDARGDTWIRVVGKGHKAGKVVLTVPEGADILAPLPIADLKTDRLAVVSSGGRLLLFPVNDLPRLPSGKGNKIMDLPGEERLTALTLLPLNQSLILTAGKRDMKIKPADLEGYAGERGRRGKPLPRGFQRVERMTIGE